MKNMKERVFLITGATDGMGKLAADVLINNAGIGFGDLNDKTRMLSEDGFELRMAVITWHRFC
jgi:NAD(P)-dependent dehydrogenase (short-subunit alcohol dehydrogenase family)